MHVCRLQWVNIVVELVFPCVVMFMLKAPPIPAFIVLFHSSIVWLKLVSYVQVNQVGWMVGHVGRWLGEQLGWVVSHHSSTPPSCG